MMHTTCGVPGFGPVFAPVRFHQTMLGPVLGLMQADTDHAIELQNGSARTDRRHPPLIRPRSDNGWMP